MIVLCFRLFSLYKLRTFHIIDEAYSYGFANNPGEPWFLHPGIDDNGYTIFVHYGKWYSGQEFMDFLTVNDGERFDFSSVISNKLDDTSPSNYELLLHFVSSFFPGKFSWDFAFLINIIFYFFTLILIVCIVSFLFRESEYRLLYAVICLIFFAFSICGTGSFTFFRMYGILSFYALLVLYSMMRISDSSGVWEYIYSIVLCIGSFMGFFTHFNFLVFAFCLTLFVCIYLLITRRIKTMFFVSISELLSVILFFLIYPFPFKRAELWMNGENSDGFSYFTRLIFSNMHTFGESIGFYIPFTISNIILWLGIVIFILIIAILFVFVLRNEKWFIKFKKTFINCLQWFWKSAVDILKNSYPWIFILFVTAVMYMLIINAIAPILTTKGYVTRYFFIGMHLVIISFVCFLLKIFDYFKMKKKLIFGPVVIFLLVFLLYNQSINYGNPFIFNKPFDKDEEIYELTFGKDVMIFSSENLDLYSLIIPLRGVNRFYFIKSEDIKSIENDIPDHPFYVMVDKDSFYEEINFGDNLGGLEYHSGNLDGTIYDYINSRLNIDGSNEFEFVRNYNSYAGEYMIYYVLNNENL